MDEAKPQPRLEDAEPRAERFERPVNVRARSALNREAMAARRDEQIADFFEKLGHLVVLTIELLRDELKSAREGRRGR